jgi:hypothetical protein
MAPSQSPSASRPSKESRFEQLRAFVEAWLAQRPAAQRVRMDQDLAEDPTVVEVVRNTADILIHTRPLRGYWARDWLVMLGRATEVAFPEAEWVGFDDLVGGRFRPASRTDQKP